MRLLVVSLFVICVCVVAGCGGSGGGFVGPLGFEGNAVFDNLNFNIVVTSIVIGEDGRPEVTFTATDDMGALIPQSAFTDARFILAVLERESIGRPFAYRSYMTQIETAAGGAQAVQASYDTARHGDMIANSDGSFTYKFDTAIPVGYDITATHQLAGQFQYLSAGDGEIYKSDIAFTFRPDGAPITETREIVATQSCNECHTRLSVHGDIRREVQLCIVCHNAHTIDAETGNSMDFAQMIHKIHRGADLPSFQIDNEPYQVSGFMNSVHDYSDVHYPQDVRNCTSCHKNAPHSDAFELAPTLEGCASCHDRTWFGAIDDTPMSFTNHTGGVQVDNSLCALCHSPEGNGVSLVSIAHLLPTKSDVAPGLELQVTNVSTLAGAPGTEVMITFTATDGDGTPVTDLADLDIVAATIAYPVPEYQAWVRETIASGFGGPDGMLTNNGDGSYVYTFAAVLPNGSTDTFAVAMEGRRQFAFRGETQTQGTSTNGMVMFTLDSSPESDRREVVSEAKCATCHEEIRAHGELRTGVSYCVMCHNPNTTDEDRRPLAELPPVTVNFKDMIHRIHSGEDLDQEYTVYGFGGTPHDFHHVRFPGLKQECSICHEDDTTSIPLSADALSTVITQDNGMTFVDEILPTRAACTSCHDTNFADAHALGQTVGAVETCAVCHSDSDNLSVALVHALAP